MCLRLCVGVTLAVIMKAGNLTWRFGVAFEGNCAGPARFVRAYLGRQIGRSLAVFAVLLVCGSPAVKAQSTNEVEQLRRQLQQLQENFERMQREQRQQIEALTGKLDDLTKQQAAEAEKKKLEQDLAAELQKKPARSARSARHRSAVGSLVAGSADNAGARRLGLYEHQLRRADGCRRFNGIRPLRSSWNSAITIPAHAAFPCRNAEIALDGAVDPYFKGFANIVLKLDQNNETSIELEETYVQTIVPAREPAGQGRPVLCRVRPAEPAASAPVGVRGRPDDSDPRVRAGWFAEHRRASFVAGADAVLHGGVSRRAQRPGRHGLQLPQSAASPTPTAWTACTAARRPTGPCAGRGDLLYVPRLASSFDLTDQQTLVVGASAAFGPNETGTDLRSEIYGVDVYWKWKAGQCAGGIPLCLVADRGALSSASRPAPTRGAAPLPAEVLRDWGFYSQVLWGFKPRWVAGLRGEYANGNHGEYDPNDVFRNERTRISPDLTFYPSEFSKIRLQYNYDHGDVVRHRTFGVAAVRVPAGRACARTSSEAGRIYKQFKCVT